MAIVFESSATGTASAASAVTVNKPSGLEVGDLMVVVGYGYRSLGHVNTPSGWTELFNSDSANVNDHWAQYKVATSGDVAASNFTWSFYDDSSEIPTDSVTSAKAIIYRISGYSGNVDDIHVTVGTLTANDDTPTFTASYDPIAPNSGVILAGWCGDSTENVAYSNWEIVSSGTSPTFTEQWDDSFGSDEEDYGLAYAVYEDADAITGFGYTIGSATISSVGGAMIVIRAQNPVPDPVPVVESVSSVSRFLSSSGTVTVTKPTGVEVGDLLIACHSFYETGSSESIITLSGWTQIASSYNSFIQIASYYKIADAGDVSASDYTWSSTGGADNWSVGMLRISGVAPTDTIQASESDLIADGSATMTATTALTPFTANSLIIFYAGIGDTTISGTASFSGYTTTPSLTWTEQVDEGHSNASSDGTIIAIATATNDSDFTEITSRSVTFSENAWRTGATGMIIVNTANSFYGSTALLATTPTEFSNSPVGDTNTTSSLLEVDTTEQSQSAKGTAPTQWTNESAPITTWTNESI